MHYSKNIRIQQKHALVKSSQKKDILGGYFQSISSSTWSVRAFGCSAESHVSPRLQKRRVVPSQPTSVFLWAGTTVRALEHKHGRLALTLGVAKKRNTFGYCWLIALKHRWNSEPEPQDIQPFWTLQLLALHFFTSQRHWPRWRRDPPIWCWPVQLQAKSSLGTKKMLLPGKSSRNGFWFDQFFPYFIIIRYHPRWDAGR